MAHEVRKTVTVVFCDVTGSTALGERLDPETLRRVMSRYFDEMRAVLEKHGGTVEKFIGDAVMAVFGIPAVHEDDALRAVRAASEMRERLRDLNKELERDHGVVIASRIGVNTGEVVAGGDDPPGASTLVTGDAVNVAARLEQAAEPGQILIGEPTHRLVRAAVTVEPVDALALKGKSESTPAFALVEVAAGASGMARHLDAPIVGRVAELAALEEALDRVVRDRRAALVTVMAPPGIGKSRLVDEFASIHERDASVVEGRCLSYGDGITYWPVVEILTAAAGITDVDTSDDVRPKIGRLLVGAGEAPVIVERLSEFLGLSGATAAPEETHWAVRKLFEALASSRPLIVLIEDVHWAEPAMLDLIEHVVGWSADAPILMLCTARPELLEERPDWGAGAEGAHRLSLEPLGPDEADELVANLIGGSPLPPTAAVLVRTAEGNALFLEQLVGMLIDDGHLRHAHGEWWVATDDLSAVAIPSTITGILESRLDRLSPQERAVLERGSVEGRVFHWSSVTALSDDIEPGEIGRHLLALSRRGLIAPADALFGGGEAFRFRHALIRDAAYARMPKSTRADLHKRHARWIEGTAGDRIAEFEDVLAYHLEQATRLRSELGPVNETDRELAARAVSALLSSAGRAAGRGDARAAVNLFERALALLPVDDPARPDVLVRYGEAVLDSGDPARAAATFEDAGALAGRLGDRRVALRARLHAADVRTITQPEDAREELELERVIAEAIPLFEDLDDDEGLAFAWKGAGVIALTKGRGADMAAAFERAATYAERAGDQGLLSEILAWQLLSAVGDRPEEGLERIERVRVRAPHDRKVGGLAAIHASMALAELGRFDEAREAYRTGYAILEDIGSRLWWAGTHFSSGWVEILADDLPAAERELRLGIDALGSMGEHSYLSTQAAVLARVLYAEGRYEEAADMADLGRRSGSPDDVSTQVPATSVQAKLLARDGHFDAALELAGEAVEMTAESDFFEVRGQALEDLAEIHERAGRPDDAAAALRQAVELYERRGILPLIERTRARLQQLG